MRQDFPYWDQLDLPARLWLVALAAEEAALDQAAIEEIRIAADRLEEARAFLGRLTEPSRAATVLAECATQLRLGVEL